MRSGLTTVGTSMVICVGLTDSRGAATPFTRTRVFDSVVGSGKVDVGAWADPIDMFDPKIVTISCGATAFVGGAKLAAFTMPSGFRKTSVGLTGA